MTPHWTHGQRVAPSKALSEFLMTLRDGVERLLEIEKKKLAEHIEARNRMGAK